MAADGPRGVADLATVAPAAGRIARPNNADCTATKHAVMVTQPKHAAVNEILLRPTAQVN